MISHLKSHVMSNAMSYLMRHMMSHVISHMISHAIELLDDSSHGVIGFLIVHVIVPSEMFPTGKEIEKE